jgi:hypothetical protein
VFLSSSCRETHKKYDLTKKNKGKNARKKEKKAPVLTSFSGYLPDIRRFNFFS